ncbi:MAG: TetR family transcriptional regulator [Luteitalea sp.]|nr:TetR family transcriptional regulator [Luteitalea sp.]
MVSNLSSVDVREQLRRATMQVFSEAGWRGATTRRIAREAGVSEVTLFRHFGSKESLIHEAMRCGKQGLANTVLPDEPVDPVAEIIAWSQAHYECIVQARSFIRRTIGEHEEHPEVGRIATRESVEAARKLASYFGKLQASGRASVDVDPWVAVNVLVGAIFLDAISRDVMPERFPYPQDEAPHRYAAMVLQVLGMSAPDLASLR